MRKLVWAALVLLIVVILVGSVWLSSCLSASPEEGETTPLPTAFAPLAAPTPAPQPTAAVPGNLLTNPSFEGSYHPQDGIMEVNVPEGWRAWFLDDPPCIPGEDPDCFACPQNCIDAHPKEKCKTDYACYWARPEFVPIIYQQAYYRIHTGETAQKYFSYGRMHEAGLYQQVSGITPGALLEFSAWMQTWMCFDYNECDGGRVSDQPDDMHTRVGIDPAGGTVLTSTNIIWSPEAHAFDEWTHFSVQAQALSSTVTVFTHSRPEWGWARTNNDVYLDDASLVVVTQTATARFSLIQPAQPELGQGTTVQVASDSVLPNATLAITDPVASLVTPAGGTMSGSEPYTWTWHFTPTLPGTYTLTFGADTLPTPIVTTVRAVAAVSLTAQPHTPWLSQTVSVYVSAYRLYFSSRLTITAPAGDIITPTYDGTTTESGIITRNWHFASVVTGTHRITYTADMLEAPVTTSVNVVSVAGTRFTPPVPPISTPVTIQMWAYYPYANVIITLTNPQGTTLPPGYPERTGDHSPFTWSWTFMPAVAGTYRYVFTAERLDAPAIGQIFVGGYTIYLPLVTKSNE